MARRFACAEGVDGFARFVACPAEALPFAEASFNAVSAVAVLEHVDDDEKAAAELARVVKPGGRAWVTVPHAFRYMPPPLWPLYWWHDKRIGHKRHYDERSLRQLFEHVGMEHVRTFYSGHPVKLLQLILAEMVPAVRRLRSPLWWRLEQIDRRGDGRRYGAVQLSLVFERPRGSRRGRDTSLRRVRRR